MTNSDLLWAELAADPENTTLKLTLIDALLEEGKIGEAEAIRWCVENGRWSCDNRTVKDFPHSHFWVCETHVREHGLYPWSLPNSVWVAIRKTRTGTPLSAREAVIQLQTALTQLNLIPN